jgi:hypothetical protein
MKLHCGFDLHFMVSNDIEDPFICYRLFVCLLKKNVCWDALPIFWVIRHFILKL